MVMFKTSASIRCRTAPATSGRDWPAGTHLHVPDPDTLAAEFASRGVEYFDPLGDTADGLRGFALRDVDGYVLFFGRTR
jgi:hypothetical protein